MPLLASITLSALGVAVAIVVLARLSAYLGRVRAAREWGVDPDQVVDYKCSHPGCSATHYTIESVWGTS